MSTIMAVEANGALSSALQGIRNAGRQFNQTSSEIASVGAQNESGINTNDNSRPVSMSEQLRDSLSNKSTMDRMFPSLSSAGTVYNANLEVVNGINNLTKSTFSIIA